MGTLIHCWWECKLVQPPLGNSMEVSQKVKNRGTWVAESDEWPTLGFSPDGDLRVMRSSSVLSGECA